MDHILFAGRSRPDLGGRLAAALKTRAGRCRIDDFPDGEIKVEVQEPLEGRTVFLLQSTATPADRHLLELLLLADACRRRGARTIVAVIPYFGYARQDRRVSGEEPIGARLIADLLACRCDRIVACDLHTTAIEGFASVPLLQLSAVPLLAEAFRSQRREDHVIVAPDAGAVKLARRYGELLQLPVAYVEKIRTSDREVAVQAVTGQVTGRKPVLVDDMISTGGTMAAAAAALLEAGAQPDISMLVSHCLLVGSAISRLEQLPVQRIITTDSVFDGESTRLPVTGYTLAEILADALRHISRGEGD